MAGHNSVMKELHALLRNVNKLFDGQVDIELDDTEQEEEPNQNEVTISLTIKPNSGLYKNAKCKFLVSVDMSTYPERAPAVTCLNNVYHPNIESANEDDGIDTADICVNLLGDDWQPEVGLDGTVMAVLFLFHHPQLDDALSCACSDLEDWEEFEANVYRSLRGESIDGRSYDKLIEDMEDGTEESKVTVCVDNKEDDTEESKVTVCVDNIEDDIEESKVTVCVDNIEDDTEESKVTVCVENVSISEKLEREIASPGVHVTSSKLNGELTDLETDQSVSLCWGVVPSEDTTSSVDEMPFVKMSSSVDVLPPVEVSASSSVDGLLPCVASEEIVCDLIPENSLPVGGPGLSEHGGIIVEKMSGQTKLTFDKSTPGEEHSQVRFSLPDLVPKMDKHKTNSCSADVLAGADMRDPDAAGGKHSDESSIKRVNPTETHTKPAALKVLFMKAKNWLSSFRGRSVRS